MNRAALRLARPSDAEAICAIYAPIVEDTAISFELEPPGPAEMRARMETVRALAPWLVLETGGGVQGYAYASNFRGRPAYRFTVETTVYVAADARGRGAGRALYAALHDILRMQGFRTVVGGITLPNAASVRLHEAMGYRPVGSFPKVGFKFGRWHDVGFWQMDLAEHVEEPSELLPLDAVTPTPAFAEALARAALPLRA